MTVTGIIAEFNPFHNGHKYLLDQAEGVKIIVLSGNFVQRGEPAIIDKWTRTQMAVDAGADLVVELPFLVAVQSADYFAKGAVEILAKLGVETLVFGTEEVSDYNQIARTYAQKSAEMQTFLASLPESLSYPQKTQAMWEEFLGIQFSGDTPNHVLGLAYAKAASHYNIRLCPIKRQGSGYHSLEKDTTFTSATSIRENRTDDIFLEQFMPDYQLFSKAPQVSWDDYWELLRYQIATSRDLTQVFQVNEELASRIKEAIKSAQNIEELVEKVATKRYTKARVRRILTYILVQAVDSPLPQAIHVLGFSEKGRSHLKNIKKEVELITRIGQEPWDILTQQADQVYQLGHNELREQTFGRVPVSKIRGE